MRYLLAGENLGKLLGPTGGVFSGDHAQRDAVGVAEHRPQHRNGLRFIVFNADQHFVRLQNMREDADPVDNLRGAVLHQAVVRRDIGFAFGGVNNQRLNFIAAAAQFAAGGETGAAEACDAKLMNAFDKRFARADLIITPAIALNPAVFAVGVNDHAHLRQPRRMSGGVRGDGGNGTGGRGVYGQHSSPSAGQRLAAQHPIAHLDAQFAFGANMLLERNDKALRQGHLAQWGTVRLGFHFGRMNTAVKIPDFIFSESGK